MTPYVQSGYVLYRVTISSVGGSVGAAINIGNQVRMLRAQVRAPLRDGQGLARCVFQEAMQDKVGTAGDGVADPDGFAYACASSCAYIWTSGFSREGDVIGLHMFRFAEGKAERMSPQELRRQTEAGIRQLDGYLAAMGMPPALRAHSWTMICTISQKRKPLSCCATRHSGRSMRQAAAAMRIRHDRAEPGRRARTIQRDQPATKKR
ncbi:hypothetical protein BRADO0794 [Bradyrhizobium sp. ORS 278]|nr:hypothetical protein BRADO0794 [Bradyrhizobium sp. ORS 278]